MTNKITAHSENQPTVETDNRTSDSPPLSAEELILQTDSTHRPTLSIVMPTLNEEEGIEECITRIRAAIEELQLYTEIIVSDSSTDRTPEIAESMGAIVVKPDEQGYGYAYRYGFARCRGDYIAMGDADTTYDFRELPKLFELIQAGDADMAIGSRLNGEIKPGAMPALHQYIGNPLLTRFLNVFYDAGVSDSHSGMRIFTREAWDRMNCKTQGMEFASEMIMEAGARGLKIKERPITYHPREGEATLESFEDGWRHVRFMLLNAPGYLFSAPGAVIGIIGAILLGMAATNVTLGGAAFGDRAIIAGSLMVITGLQVVAYGVYATIASNPIRQPRDPVSAYVTEHMTLEAGVATGVVLSLLGAGYGTWTIIRWVGSEFTILPSIGESMLAFTAIVVGVQAIFGSFFIGTLSNR